MPISGLRDTSNFVTDQRPQNWREGIMFLYPNGSVPLTALTSLMKTRKVDDYSFNWWDKQHQSRRVALTANINASDTSTIVAVANGAKGYKVGDIFYSEHTGELFRLQTDPASDTALDLTRGFAGSTKVAITYNGAGVNPNLTCIGSAYEEGSSAPTGVNYDPVKRSNYTQIFRNTFEGTRTAFRTRLRTGDAVKEAKRECLELHSGDMERAFWFGRAVDTTHKGKPLHTTAGILNYIDAGNIVDANADYPGGVTMTGLEEYMYNAFKWGSNEKMIFGGNRSLLTLQQIFRKNAQWDFQSGIKEFGMNVTRIECPFGSLVFKNHPLFNRMVGGTTGGTDYYGVESWMIVLDMNELNYVHLEGADTQYQPKLADNGMDGMKSGYLTEAALELHHPTAHYVIKNVAKSAVG